MNEQIRTFDTGATRDIATGKLEYSNYIHPLCDYSFSNYMKWKQIIWWEYRRGDNWQKGIPDESLFDSLVRHMEIVKLLRKWYDVWETKKEWIIELLALKEWELLLDKEYEFVEQKNIETELNAVRFNSEALKLYYLNNKNEKERI